MHFTVNTPAVGKVTGYEPDTLGVLSNPRAGTLTSCAAPPLHANVTVPPGAIVTVLGDQR